MYKSTERKTSKRKTTKTMKTSKRKTIKHHISKMYKHIGKHLKSRRNLDKLRHHMYYY